MKRLTIAAVSIALMAGVGTASAKTSKKTSPKKGYHTSQGTLVQRNVRLQPAPLANADLKYGPYPEYPQSPPGGGY
jgi:hypothetical protein